MNDFNIRFRYFDEGKMLEKVRGFARDEKLEETFEALEFMREHHDGQFRKHSKFATEEVPYINHPLLMACQAHAYGIRDDALLAAILLHDVVEDTEVTIEQLPFSQEVKNLVGLVTFSVPEGMEKAKAKDTYYKDIAGNGKASLIKIIDRCNNVSTMAGSFTEEKMAEYVRETEKYVLPLIDVLKANNPEYSDIAFLVKYQIISVLETIKCMSVDK